MRLDAANAFVILRQYKALLGYVPEEPHLYSYLTGPEYLRLVGRLRQIPAAVLDDKIDRFLAAAGHLRRSLSDAVVLLEGHAAKSADCRRGPPQPRIVVLDEPFSGLDVSAARVLKASSGRWPTRARWSSSARTCSRSSSRCAPAS